MLFLIRQVTGTPRNLSNLIVENDTIELRKIALPKSFVIMRFNMVILMIRWIVIVMEVRLYMLKSLSHGVKISITRSISQAFEQYMNSISWDEKKVDFNKFLQEWRSYSDGNASWFDKIDNSIKSDPTFHEELAEKINETMEKVLSEEPTEEQINEINHLVKALGVDDVNYSCKAESKYHIEQLTNKLKKNSNI